MSMKLDNTALKSSMTQADWQKIAQGENINKTVNGESITVNKDSIQRSSSNSSGFDASKDEDASLDLLGNKSIDLNKAYATYTQQMDNADAAALTNDVSKNNEKTSNEVNNIQSNTIQKEKPKKDDYSVDYMKYTSKDMAIPEGGGGAGGGAIGAMGAQAAGTGGAMGAMGGQQKQYSKEDLEAAEYNSTMSQSIVQKPSLSSIVLEKANNMGKAKAAESKAEQSVSKTDQLLNKAQMVLGVAQAALAALIASNVMGQNSAAIATMAKVVSYAQMAVSAAKAAKAAADGKWGEALLNAGMAAVSYASAQYAAGVESASQASQANAVKASAESAGGAAGAAAQEGITSTVYQGADAAASGLAKQGITDVSQQTLAQLGTEAAKNGSATMISGNTAITASQGAGGTFFATSTAAQEGLTGGFQTAGVSILGGLGAAMTGMQADKNAKQPKK